MQSHQGTLLQKIILCAGLGMAACTLPSAHADPQADQAAIEARLHTWAAAFNARDAAGTCAIFTLDLVASTPGIPDASHDTVCTRLAEALAQTNTKLHYQPNIHEILLSGDLAAVRLTWTLTTDRAGQRHISKEAGLDIFQRQADGQWAISRFMSHPLPGPKRN